ncbi:hypothetical protein [yado-kari virus 4a]|uniref:Uncharacterized protein n=1 Tax=yado-kari virus 4a TaxID=3120768 RepID=A0ABM7EZ79_9VIRU|nr:hypothetical protein QKP73_gp2 [Yado-kari virus 4]BBB86806.1 hypothetical protein [Yado-kari virus 4]
MTHHRGTSCRRGKFSSSFDEKEEVSGPNQPKKGRDSSKIEIPFDFDDIRIGRQKWETFIGSADEAEHTLFFYFSGFGFHIPSWTRQILGDFVMKKGGIGIIAGNSVKKLKAIFGKDELAISTAMIVSICMAYARSESHEKAKARRMRKKMIADWLKTKKTGLEHVLKELKTRFASESAESKKWRETKSDEDIAKLEKLGTGPMSSAIENNDGVEETRVLNDGSLVPVSKYDELVKFETDESALLRVYVRRLEHKGISIFDKAMETDIHAIEQVLAYERFKTIEDESLAQQIRALKQMWMAYTFTGLTIGTLKVVRESSIPLVDAMGKPYIRVRQIMGAPPVVESSDLNEEGAKNVFCTNPAHNHTYESFECDIPEKYTIIVFFAISDEQRRQHSENLRTRARANEASRRDRLRYAERVSKE